MSSLYFPFDQLIRIPDFDSVDLFTGPHTSTGADSRSVSKQQGRKAVGHGLPKLDIIDGKVSRPRLGYPFFLFLFQPSY